MFETNSMQLATFSFSEWSSGLEIIDVVISVGILVCIPLLILGLFSQKGKVEVSAMRQAALATGHRDRETLFENQFLRPILWPLLAASHGLGMPKLKNWIRRKLVASGNPSFLTPEEFLALASFNGLSLAMVLEVVLALSEGQIAILGPIVVYGFVVFMSLMQLRARAAARLQVISRKVPYALDLLALAMGAGATFVEAVRTVSRENTDDPFNVELNTMLAEIELGSTRRRALLNLADRVPLESLRNVVASAVQAEELGTPLADVLHAQANLMRLNRSVAAEHAAARASVRILLPGLLIMLGVVLVLFAPAIIRFVQAGGFGGMF